MVGAKLDIFFKMKNAIVLEIFRGVARGGAGGARAPSNLADQLTLFEPGWADFAPHAAASPPGFKKLSTSLIFNVKVESLGAIEL